eukprot:11026108-Alexandrium_andersonii.AAC.1
MDLRPSSQAVPARPGRPTAPASPGFPGQARFHNRGPSSDAVAPADVRVATGCLSNGPRSMEPAVQQ